MTGAVWLSASLGFSRLIGGNMRAFRMDDRKQRLIVDGGLTNGERFFGWEVTDATALNALAARLKKAGVAGRRETIAVADQRCAAEVISFRDPAGNRVEAFHGGQIADEPFRPSRHIGGFRTGTQGMGHAVLIMPEIDAALTFYRDLLGFRITDFMGPPVSLYFMHVNVYGIRRFPVTLYKEQWLKLLDRSSDIRAFIAANKAQLKAKDR